MGDKRQTAQTNPNRRDQPSAGAKGDPAHLPDVGLSTLAQQEAHAPEGHLGDGQLQDAQRRILAAEIGRAHGNHHLQRLIAGLRRPEGPATAQQLGPHFPVLQRVVMGDVTQMSITGPWAEQLTDDELEEQTQLVRGQLRAIDPASPAYQVAWQNHEILEAEARRRSDPRRQLAHQILDQVQRRGGLTVAVYVTQQAGVRGRGEFRSQAGQFAADHQAVGLASGVLQFGAAMELTSDLAGLLQSLSASIQEVLAVDPSLADRTSLPVPIQTLAIFTHGTRTGLQAASRARWIRNTLASWVEGIAPYLSSGPLIALYACSTAGAPPTGLPFAEELQLALQAELEAQYGAEAGAEPVVWGHTTAGHTTANRNLVEFRGSSASVSTDLLGNLGQRLADLAIQQAEAQRGAALALSDAQRGALADRSRRAMARILRAQTGRLDPTNTFIREIPFIGVDRVWLYLSTEASPDLSDLDLAPDAVARVASAVAIFQERFAREKERLIRQTGSL